MSVYNRVIEKDLGWNEIVKEHKKIKGIKIKVGLFGSGDASQNVAARGAVHEWGIEIPVTDKMRAFLRTIDIHLKASTTKITIPQRAFMRGAFDGNMRNLERFIQTQYTLFVMDKISMKIFLNRIGVEHTAQIKDSITKGSWTPNHPKTVQNKGSSKPLINKGVMVNSVKHKIEGTI